MCIRDRYMGFKDTPHIETIQMPEPKNGQVLVKVMAAPIHPADFWFIKGLYSSKRKPPTNPGVEGCGIVIKNGGGLYGCFLVGKHVGFIAADAVMGSWAEYTICDSAQCSLMIQSMPFEITAAALTNPVSCHLMYETTVQDKHQAVVSTAACSSIGRMINAYFTEHGISVINVVNKVEQEEILKNQDKAQYVLNMLDDDFDQQLKDLCSKLNATGCWDVVGGDLTGRILKALPPKSIIYIYGSLSLKNCTFNAAEIIFQKKQIQGFWLKDKISYKSLL
eukprot:TRINITY_DN11235_c0_g1_i1.p1 TRINITY_DN11235_c0_g1~~TRINITY_DN11235_c0_g1_i1.p1  ORF type:complete len:278 (+),score=40.86 TRINITY_DN11235_c0_g1_i1:157-990(+)